MKVELANFAGYYSKTIKLINNSKYTTQKKGGVVYFELARAFSLYACFTGCVLGATF